MDFEKKEKASYILDTGPKTWNECTKYYFHCHRSYDPTHKPKATGRKKHLGTNKFGRACPSTMLATVMPDGTVLVEVWPMHVGHSKEIGRLFLAAEDRKKIAGI